MKTNLIRAEPTGSAQANQATSRARPCRSPGWTAMAVSVLLGTAFALSGYAQHNTTVTVDGVATNLTVSFSGTNNLLRVSNGGTLTNAGTFTSTTASYNTGVVQGNGTMLTNTTVIYVGFQGTGNNLLVVSNQAKVVAAGFSLGFDSTGVNTNNGALFTDAGTRVTSLGAISLGRGPSWNWMTVSNGAVLTITVNGTTIGAAGSPSNNRLLVTGSNSQWISSGIIETKIGMFGQSNSITIADGGFMSTYSTIISEQAGAGNNRVVVTGRGSVLTNFTGANVGYHGAGSQLLVSNGGTVYAASSGAEAVGVGYYTDGSGSVLVTGDGSLLSTPGGVAVGSNGTWKGAGQLLVTDGGVVQVSQLRGGYNGTGTISNRGGVFQFTTAAPTINPLTAGTIVVTNGVISFRSVGSAPILGGSQLTNIVFQGDNGYQLNAATNAAGLAAYTFDSVANTLNPTNYQRLILTGANPSWRSTALTIAGGGELLVTNAANASVVAAVSNAGAIRVINSTVKWSSNMVVAGLYYSDPSTNTFTTNLTVAPSGALYGSNGDLFVFHKDLVVQSTNRTQFDLSSATVLFTNAAFHNLSLSGSGALDKGSNWLSVADLATNFSIGTLSIALGNKVVVQGDAGTNALYVGWLNIQGIQTNTYAEVTNGIFSALGLPSINLYYDKYVAGNDYLMGQTYDLWGGSLLIPIPEPGALALLLAGALVLARRMRGRDD